jgi:hypothetical protein
MAVMPNRNLSSSDKVMYVTFSLEFACLCLCPSAQTAKQIGYFMRQMGTRFARPFPKITR